MSIEALKEILERERANFVLGGSDNTKAANTAYWNVLASRLRPWAPLRAFVCTQGLLDAVHDIRGAVVLSVGEPPWICARQLRAHKNKATHSSHFTLLVEDILTGRVVDP